MVKKRAEAKGQKEALITVWRAKLRGDLDAQCFNHYDGDFTIIIHDCDIPVQMFMKFLHEIIHVGIWMFLPDLGEDAKKEHRFIERIEKGVLKLIKELY